MIMEVSSNSEINWNATGFNKIADNVANILKTKIGEIPFIRNMGISQEYIDMPISDIKGQLISDSINAINNYESRATVSSIEIVEADSDGEISIKVVIEI